MSELQKGLKEFRSRWALWFLEMLSGSPGFQCSLGGNYPEKNVFFQWRLLASLLLRDLPERKAEWCILPLGSLCLNSQVKEVTLCPLRQDGFLSLCLLLMNVFWFAFAVSVISQVLYAFL